MGSNTEPETVFVELLGEGTKCVRPVSGLRMGEGTYKLQPTPDYDADDEHWEFPPGSIVRCRKEVWNGDEVLVARELIAKG
jgi:hypothetical protein